MRIKEIDTLTAHRIRAGIIDNPPSKLPFKLSIGSLNTWLNALPFTNIPLACEKLSQVLNSLNSNDIPGVLRLQLIEEIRPFTLSLLKVHEDKLLILKFPLTPETKELVQFSISLHELLSTAYSQVILSNDFTMPSSGRYFKKIAAPFDLAKQVFVIYHALRSLGLVLIKSAQSYQAPPDNTWGKINLLFQLAAKNNITQSLINNDSASSSSGGSIDTLFKSLHLLHLSSPNRFNQREIASIYNLLVQSENLLTVSPEQVIAGKAATFHVDLSSSTPATHTSKIKNDSSSILFLHIEPFLEQLSNQALSNEPSEEAIINCANKAIRLPTQTIRRLLQCWSQQSIRQFTRDEKNQEVTLYPNLQNVLKKLSKTSNESSNLQAAVKNKALRAPSLELIPLDTTSTITHIEKVRSKPINGSILNTIGEHSEANNLDIWQRTSKPTGEAESFKSNTTNSSAKGYQVNLNDQLVSQIKAGDLIGISLDDVTLEIAVVRRMTALDDGGLSLGLELIAPHAEVVKIINKSSSIRSRYVLMLPAIPSINQAISIISPSPIKLPDDVILLARKKLKETYRIHKLIESSAAFSHYSLAKKTETK